MPLPWWRPGPQKHGQTTIVYSTSGNPCFENDCFVKAGGTKKGADKSGPCGAGDEADENGFDIEALVEELYRRRLKLDERAVGPDSAPQFEGILRGGAWAA